MERRSLRFCSRSRRQSTPGARSERFGGIVTAVGTAATGIAPNATAAAALQALAGVGNGADVVASDTLVQQLVPREMLGRIFGLVGTAAFTGSALAYVLAGLLLDLTSIRTTLIVGGVGVLVAIPVFGRAMWRAGRTR